MGVQKRKSIARRSPRLAAKSPSTHTFFPVKPGLLVNGGESPQSIMELPEIEHEGLSQDEATSAKASASGLGFLNPSLPLSMAVEFNATLGLRGLSRPYRNLIVDGEYKLEKDAEVVAEAVGDISNERALLIVSF